jgi:hypothetical protein
MATNNSVDVGLAGQTGTGSFVGSIAPTLSSLTVTGNTSGNSFTSAYATTATAAATTTLLVGSTQQQYFTGSTTQTVLLPVTSTLALGQSYYIVNNSSGVVTVESSGANSIKAMAANSTLLVTVISTSGTTAASWNYVYSLKSPASGIANDGLNAAGQFVISDSTTGAISTTSNIWDATNNSIYLAGSGVYGTGTYKVGIGDGTTGNGDNSNSVAIGRGITIQGVGCTVIGSFSSAINTRGIAIGYSATSSGIDSVGIAVNSTAQGDNSIAIGNSSTALGIYGIAIGYSANAGAANGIAIGKNATAVHAGSCVIVDSSGTNNTDSVANLWTSTFTAGYDFYAGTILALKISSAGNAIFGQNIELVSGKSIADTSGNPYFQFYTSVSAVNYIDVNNAQTGNSPTLTAAGSDTNIALTLIGQGTGGVNTQGTRTNNNAPTGYVGEFISSSIVAGSAVSLSTGVANNITSISLTAGDWDVEGNVFFTVGGTCTICYAWSSLTSATTPDASLVNGKIVTSGIQNFGTQVPFLRVCIATTTTVYLSAISTFSTSIVTVCGNIYARRVR